MENSGHVEKVKFWLVFMGVISFVFMTTLVGLYFHEFGFEVEKDRANWGALGDFFGGITSPIFGLISFIIVGISLFFQSRELSESISSIRLQQFEQTFFNLLNAQTEIKDSIIFTANGKGFSGSEAISLFYNEKLEFEDVEGLVERKRHIEEVTLDFIHSFGQFIFQYVSNFQALLSFVNNSSVRNKELYLELISTRVSPYELCFLFYVSFGWGADKRLKREFKNLNLDSYIYSDYLYDDNDLEIFRKD